MSWLLTGFGTKHLQGLFFSWMLLYMIIHVQTLEWMEKGQFGLPLGRLISLMQLLFQQELGQIVVECHNILSPLFFLFCN